MRNGSLLAVIALCILGPGVALAHGIALDKYGCHKNRYQQQRVYECHNGALKGERFKSREDMLRELHRRERLKAPPKRSDSYR
jgi:hypothetical protein